ncbi:DUF1674-domain-containing protein [Annulohypoxylon moriforme]|nr:DUF1674-domain-containing protein [Annulohypoxylon moriforme]
MASRLTHLNRLARQSSILSRLQNRQPIRHASNNPSNSNSDFNPFQSAPSPLRLPPDQQAEFERLQRTANTQEGFNPTSTPDFSTPATATANSPSAKGDEVETPALEDEFGSIPLRKGAPPEFEGEVNPKTGEVGGPKNEPLRWGPGGDYSFNGRVTDF